MRWTVSTVYGRSRSRSTQSAYPPAPTPLSAPRRRSAFRPRPAMATGVVLDPTPKGPMTSPRPSVPRHELSILPMRIAMVGTAALSARNRGVGVTIDEIGQRLARRGHQVTVYGARGTAPHGGMRLVPVPTLPGLRPEALTRAALSAAHLSASGRQDVVFVFGTGNAPFVTVLRSRGAAVALHVGALEWKREGLGVLGRRYHRRAEELAVRDADALITSTRGAADYYEDEFGAATDTIVDGCRILTDTPSDAIRHQGLVPGRFHLVASEFAPENHVDTIMEGYHCSDSTLPLVVVGSASSANRYVATIESVARRDRRIRLLGDLREDRIIDQLFAHAASYLHGHSLGDSGPALLRAMGAGTSVICWEDVFNREIAGTAGSFFSSPAGAARCIEEVERYPARFRDIGELMQERARTNHGWDGVAEAYEALASRLARGFSTRGAASGRRTASAGAARPVVGAERAPG